MDQIKQINRLSYIVDGFAYTGLLCIFLSIWIDLIRWKIFFTGLFLFILMLLIWSYKKSLIQKMQNQKIDNITNQLFNNLFQNDN